MQVFENLRCIQHAPGVQMQEVSGMQILPKPMLSWKVKFIKRFTLLFTCYVKLLNSWAAFDNYIWVNGIILGSLVYWIWHFYKCWSSGTQTDMSNKFCYHLVDSLGIAIAPDVRLAVWCQLSGPQWFSHYEVLCFNLSKEKFYVLNYEKWKKVHIWEPYKTWKSYVCTRHLKLWKFVNGMVSMVHQVLGAALLTTSYLSSFLKSDIGFGWMYQNYWTDSNVSSVSGSAWLLYSGFWRRWAEPWWAHGS